MAQLKFEDSYSGSIEEKKLIETPLKEVDYKTICKAVKSDLNDKKNGKSSKEQILGYEFEWEIWDLFHKLKPSLMNHPAEKFKFDLTKYRPTIINKAKNLSEKQEKACGEANDLKDIDKILSPQNERETDVVAIFDRHIFVIECKASGKSRSINDLEKRLDRFLVVKPFIEKRCAEIFGESFNAVFIACSKNFQANNIISSAYLKSNSIIIFDELRRGYIEEVLNESGSPEFALTQFLGFFRSGKPDFNEIIKTNTPNKKGKTKKEKIQITKKPWEISSFTSVSGIGKKNEVYTFSLKPDEMLKISTVAHQQFNNIFDAEQVDANYYQRILTSTRLESIKKHLEKKSTPFANNILVSYRGADDKIQFIPDSTSLNSDPSVKGNIAGKLILDACPGTFHVIDGQHRLFGYTSLNKVPKGLRDTHRVIVTAFKGLTVAEEAEIFLEVNSNAKPIVPSLLMEIEWASKGETLSNLCNGFIFGLRSNTSSPLHLKINDAQKNSKSKLAPKNLKTAISKFECFGGTNFDKWINNNHRRTSLPDDDDIVIFWSRNFNETLNNYYVLFSEMITMFKLVNPDRWHPQNGVIRNIFFAGLMQAMDRIVISAIEEWRSNNPNVTLETYFKLPKDTAEEQAFEKFKKQALTDIYQNAMQKMKDLASGFANLPEEEKDKILHKDAFKLGAGAEELPCTYLVKKFLSKYKDLVRDKDDENWERIENNLTAAQIITLKAKLKKQEKEIAKHLRDSSVPNKLGDMKHRAGKHFDELKNVSNSILSRTISPKFWNGLIMTQYFAEYDVPKINKDGGYDKGNVWFGVHTRHTKHIQDYGENAYEDPWDFVETENADLLGSPRNIIKAPNYSWEKKVRALQYLWEIMLIPKQGEEIESYDWDEIVNDDFSTQDNSIWQDKEKDMNKILQSNHWKASAKYIRLFGQIRNFDRHTPTKESTVKPWEKHRKEFEYYEPLYIEKLEEAKVLFEKLQAKEDKEKEEPEEY
tara:strand:- start:863 stop:3823 length:2961 start_codon:yes stop_codon:yes gene_type:complete